MEARKVSAAALALVGTPFHAQGRLPGVGLDCVGVIVCVARACGLPHHDVTAYPMTPNGTLLQELASQLLRVPGEAQEGDVLAMSFGSEPHHVAILVDGGRIVHAYSRVHRCVVQSYTEFWHGKVRAVYRFPEVV